MTEMSPVVHFLPCDRFLAKAGSVGILAPNLEARLVGQSGIDVNLGEPGELWLRGPTVMKVGTDRRIRVRMSLIPCTIRVI